VLLRAKSPDPDADADDADDDDDVFDWKVNTDNNKITTTTTSTTTVTTTTRTCRKTTCCDMITTTGDKDPPITTPLIAVGLRPIYFTVYPVRRNTASDPSVSTINQRLGPTRTLCRLVCVDLVARVKVRVRDRCVSASLSLVRCVGDAEVSDAVNRRIETLHYAC